MNYQKKYLKYKNKYLKSKNQIGGMTKITFVYKGKSITADVYDYFLCDKALMRDPVIASDGFSYERSYIEALLLKPNPISPKTNQNLTKTLIPNHSLKYVINEFIEIEFLKNATVDLQSIPSVKSKTIVNLYAGFGKRFSGRNDNSERLILPFRKQMVTINEIYDKYTDTWIIYDLEDISKWKNADSTPMGMQKNFNYLYFGCDPLYIEIEFENLETGKNFVKEVNNTLNYVDTYPIKYGGWEVCALLVMDLEENDFSDEDIYDRDKDSDKTNVTLYGGYYRETHRPYHPDTDIQPSSEKLDKVLEIYSRYVNRDNQKFKDFQTNLMNESSWHPSYALTCMKDTYDGISRPKYFTFEFDCKRDVINFVRDINIELNIDERGNFERYGEWEFCATIHFGGSNNDMMEFNKINTYITNYE
jgi:hypothetical protein